MLFRKLTIGTILAVMLLLSACTAPNGSIVILENPNGTSFTMDFMQYSEKNKCELSLAGGDVLQLEVTRDSGKVTLSISGKNGSEPYTGNDLQPGLFTVAISETDDYVIRITGENATGNITITNLGGKN